MTDSGTDKGTGTDGLGVTKHVRDMFPDMATMFSSDARSGWAGLLGFDNPGAAWDANPLVRWAGSVDDGTLRGDRLYESHQSVLFRTVVTFRASGDEMFSGSFHHSEALAAVEQAVQRVLRAEKQSWDDHDFADKLSVRLESVRFPLRHMRSVVEADAPPSCQRDLLALARRIADAPHADPLWREQAIAAIAACGAERVRP